MKHIEVVAAVILHNNKILCVQRNENKYEYISKKYEFPGGKVEAGETNEDAIIREIKEELNMDISILSKYLVVEHTYPDFKMTMYSYLCHASDELVTLTEHIDYKWLHPEELMLLDWAAADLPIVYKLMEF